METLEEKITELKKLANELDKMDDLKYHGIHTAAIGISFEIERLEKANGLFIEDASCDNFSHHEGHDLSY